MSPLSKLIDKLVSFEDEESREQLTGYFKGSIFFNIANAWTAPAVAGTPWPSPQSLVLFLDAFLFTFALSLFMLTMCPGVNDDDKTRSTARTSFAIFLIGAAILCVALSAYLPAQG